VSAVHEADQISAVAEVIDHPHAIVDVGDLVPPVDEGELRGNRERSALRRTR